MRPVSLWAAFPPLLAWQRRLWLTVGEFLDSAAAAPAEADLSRQEADMRAERNYFVRTVTHNFQETHQLSVAIARLQGLTAALRVRELTGETGRGWEEQRISR